MDISLISIGNSKGMRLPKAILDKYNIKDAVELVLEKNYFIVRPKISARKGWDNAFKKMHANGDDKPLLDDVFKDESI
jgi:antitoxin MazE